VPRLQLTHPAFKRFLVSDVPNGSKPISIPL